MQSGFSAVTVMSNAILINIKRFELFGCFPQHPKWFITPVNRNKVCSYDINTSGVCQRE